MVYTIHLWRMVYYWFTSINMYPHHALLYFVFVFLHELFVDFTHVPVYPVSELALAKQQYDKGPKFLTSKISPKGCAYCDTKSIGSEVPAAIGAGLDADCRQDLWGTMPDATGLGWEEVPQLDMPRYVIDWPTWGPQIGTRVSSQVFMERETGSICP